MQNRYRLFLCVMLFCLLGVLPSIQAQNIQSDCPALKIEYTAPGRAVLARFRDQAVTEEDLLLFLTLSKAGAPNLYNRFQKVQNPKEKAELKEKIKDAIRSYVTTRELSLKYSSEKKHDKIVNLKKRMLAYPAYELVWVDQILRSKIRIRDEDIVAYYRRYKEKYERPASVRLRLFYVPAPRVLPELERQKIRQKIEEFRARALEGEDFEYLVKTYSSSFPGTDKKGIMEVYKSETYNRFYEEARAIKINRFSPVFSREHGFFFLQCLDKKDPEVIPLSSVKKEIRQILKARSLRFLYSIELDKLIKKYHPGFHWCPWDEMKNAHILIRIGKLKITKTDFWQLFPEIIGEDFSVNKQDIFENAQTIHRFECIRMEVEKKLKSPIPFIKTAEIIASDLFQATRFLEVRLASLKTVSDEELKEYYDNNPNLATEDAWREIKQVVGEVINPVQYDDQALVDVLQKMEINFERLRREALKIVEKEKEKYSTAPPEASEDPYFPISLFKDLLKKYSTDLYKFEIRDIGRVHSDSAPDIWQQLEPLHSGEFSEIERTLHFVHCFYVETAHKGQIKPFEEVKRELRKHLVQSRMEKAGENMKKQALQETQIRFELE